MADHNPIVLAYYENLLRLSDVELLNGPYWLNDTVISFYFQYLEMYVFQMIDMFLFVPPQVTQCVKVCNEDEISVFLDPLHCHWRKFVFFALNDNQHTDESGGTHWSLLVYSHPEQCCFHFDSSHGVNSVQAHVLGSKVLKYMGVHPNNRVLEAPCLQQDNGYDCGTHVIAQCELLATFASTWKCIGGAPMLDRHTLHQKRRELYCLIQRLRMHQTHYE